MIGPAISGFLDASSLRPFLRVRGAITYGYAKDSHTPKVIESTCDLLQATTKRIILQSPGPRFLLGDFNLEEHQIDLTELWKDYGFVEAQTFAHHMWGQTPINTCKHKTRKDHLWLSREILPFVRKVVVDDTWFSDHALVYAEIAPLGPMEPIPVWRKPMDLPWDQIETSFQPAALDLDPSQTEAFFGALWKQTEQQVDANLRQRGHQGLTQAQMGRAATHEVAWKKQEIPPLKRPRKSDFQEQFIGEHRQHYHWTRQLRRLQSYCQLVFPKQGKTINFDQQMALWRSILSSQGFTRGFRKFWPESSVKTAGAPELIPRWPPNHHDASLIFEGFKAIFMDFEATLIKNRRASAKLARLKDPHKIYQDTAKPQAMPVHTLLTTKATEVMETTDEGRVYYTPGELDPQEPVKGPNGPLTIAHHSLGQLLLDPDTVEVGDVLTQEKFIADRREMFGQFQTLWEARWDKHRHTDARTWDPFCNFVDSMLQPPTDMPLSPITLSQWHRALQTKKGKSAKGPDGVSRLDLQRLPHSHTQQLLDMFWAIEQGAPWPSALQVGLITAIEKHAAAASPTDYRPICVLPMAYRTWASIRTKQILAWLSKFAPPGLIGNRSQKECAHIWWSIAAAVEQAWYDGDQLCGGICDIVKCYNCLPRIPVFAIAKHMRLPATLLHAWFRSITGLERRFVITGGTGPAMRSTTGFPEGDPLSVCSMFLINLALFEWVARAEPSASLWTFVDNLEVTSHTPEAAASSLDAIEAFCNALDVQLDTTKTAYWATSSFARDHLRQSGQRVVLDIKDLGAQMTFCRRHTNKVVRGRAYAQPEFWARLARSCAPQRQKEICLRVSAWPRALNGISTVIFGQEHICKLRTKALRSFGWTNKGTHPMLQLSCLCDIRSDPGYWCVWRSIVAFRRFADPVSASETLDFLISHPEKRIDPGPCGVLLQRLHSIAWAWEGQGWVKDHQGFMIHLCDSPLNLLKQRLQHGWQSFPGPFHSFPISSSFGISCAAPTFPRKFSEMPSTGCSLQWDNEPSSLRQPRHQPPNLRKQHRGPAKRMMHFAFLILFQTGPTGPTEHCMSIWEGVGKSSWTGCAQWPTKTVPHHSGFHPTKCWPTSNCRLESGALFVLKRNGCLVKMALSITSNSTFASVRPGWVTTSVGLALRSVWTLSLRGDALQAQHSHFGPGAIRWWSPPLPLLDWTACSWLRLANQSRRLAQIYQGFRS